MGGQRRAKGCAGGVQTEASEAAANPQKRIEVLRSIEWSSVESQRYTFNLIQLPVFRKIKRKMAIK